MSNYCNLLGYLTVPGKWGTDELNRQAIDQLPQEDGDPWLIRSMFALPSAQTYRDQMYHFGTVLAHFPHISPSLSRSFHACRFVIDRRR